MTNDEMVAAIRADSDGKEIESKVRLAADKTYSLVHSPTWNFRDFDYREKLAQIMTRPNTTQLIASLNWHMENDLMSGAERQIIVDAIDLLRDLAFTHIEKEHDGRGL